jgi:integrase
MLFEFEDQGNGGSTVNRKMSAFSMMLKTAIDQGWLKSMPKVPRRREGAHRIRWMNEDEEKVVMTTCEHLGLHDLRDFIAVAIDTGFRRGELLRFKSKDFSNGLLHLHAGTTKTDEARAVPATKRVIEILGRRAHLERVFDSLTPHTLRWQWDRLRERMGLLEDPQFVVHMLRHTCASRLVQRGVPLVVVKTWMGHKTIATTMRYAHLAPENLNQALKALEGILEAPPAVPVKALELADADF